METLMNLVVSIQNAAPKVWETAMKQVAVTITQDLFFIGVFLIVGVMSYNYGTKEWALNEEYAYEQHDVAGFAAWLIAAVCFVAVILLIVNVAGMVANPEYYAMQLIIGSFK